MLSDMVGSVVTDQKGINNLTRVLCKFVTDDNGLVRAVNVSETAGKDKN